MSNSTGNTIGFPTFIGVIRKAMLTVMDSGEGYMEALAADGIPGTELNAEGVTVVSATNHRELTGFLQEVVRKIKSPLIVGRRYGTEFSIRLVR